MSRTQKIREFIESHLVISNNEKVLKDDDNIFELGFVDSLFALQLVSFIEKEFEIELENNDLDLKNFSSINSIVSFLENKLGR